MSTSDELILLERVFLRVGSADTDEQLENAVSKFLPPVLLKLSSPNEAVRNKVMELLSHINKRIKNRQTIQLPVEALLVQYQDPSASAFITNFTIIYIKLGFPRLPQEKQSQLLPTLVHAAEGKPTQHQESLLFLLIGSLGDVRLPGTCNEAKSFLGLSEKPKLSKLLLEIILDLLLIPYGWTSENPPPELSTYALQRIRNNFPWIATPEKLEQLKLKLIKFLSCGVFKDSDTLVHLVIATGDSRSTVCNAGDMQLRKVIGDIDLDSNNIILPLYMVFLGSGEGDRKRRGACTRLRLKLLPQLSRSKAIFWPAAIKVLFDSLYGENTNPKLKSLGLTYCSSVIHHVAVEELTKVGSVILDSGLIKLLKDPGDYMIQRQAYSVMGQLVCRVPSLASLDLLKTLFSSLSQENEKEIQTSIRDAMVMMCGAFKGLNENDEITALLRDMLQSQVPKCRSVALHYLADSTPRTAAQLYILLSAATHQDEDVATEAKKALYGSNYKSGEGNITALPPFTELFMLIMEKEGTKPVDAKLHTEILFYLRLCLANAAGVKATVNQIQHPCEHSAAIRKYLRKIQENQPLTILQYLNFIYALLDVEPGPVPLNCLVECVGCIPDSLLLSLRTKLDKIKSLVVDTREEVRESSAQLMGLLAERGTLGEYSGILEAGGKNFESLHGAMLVLGNAAERQARLSHSLLTDPRPVRAVVKYLTHSHPLLVNGACISLSLMGQAQPLPLAVEEKENITNTLLDIVLETKHSSKVKDRACSALASMCIGEDFPPREVILKRFLDSSKEVRDLELHLSTGDTIVSALLGPTSPERLDPWVREGDEADRRTKAGAKEEDLTTNFLSRLLSMYRQPHPHIRQSCCFWLLAVTKHCEDLNPVKNRLQDIQSAFMDFLSDNSSVVQEAAGKGLALVYQNGDAESKAELLGKVVEQLTLGKRSVNQVTSETKLFEEGVLGKSPTGGNLTTYKELCSLASDLNKPDLIYKFMHLVNHNAIWNSKKGAAYGVSSLVSLAGEELETQLPSIVAKLYRYQYDPTPNVQQAMTSIWHSITASTSNIVEKFHKEIFDDLLVNLTAPQWRVRISCCQALADFMRGGGSKIFEDCVDKIPELWKQLFRVMDDIHEGTREAATNATKILSKICIRHCENELRKSGEKLSAEILPILMNIGIKHNVSEVRSVSVTTVSEMVKGGVSPELVPGIVIALLVAAAELESQGLNALSVMLSSSTQAQETMESLKASAVKSHFTVQTLTKIVHNVKPEMMEELAPQMVDMLKSSVGLGSRVATSHFLVLLSHHLTIQQMQPYVGKFLGALLNGLTDRNAAIRKTCATTIGQLTKCAKDSSVDRLITKLSTLYFEKEDEGTRSAVCYTLQAMVTYSQDATKNRPDLTLPLVFFAKHQEKKIDGSNKNILEAWEEVWGEVCSSQNMMLQNEDVICQTLEQCMQSQAWHNKAQAARAIKTLCTKIGEKLGPERRDKLVEILVSGLSGRTWEGKEYLLDAVAAVCKNCPSLKGSGLENVIIDTVIKEAQKEKISYRIHALKSLADILHTLEVDKFDKVYEIVREILKKGENKDEDSEDEGRKKKEDLEVLKETAYLTLGKCWPSTPATQDKYREEVVRECVVRLELSTRNVQVAIVVTLGDIAERLTILQKPGAEGNGATASVVVDHFINALAFAFGIPKHTKLRKEALNLLSTLRKLFKGTNETEYKKLQEVFNTFADTIGRDTTPEIKSRFIDLKESFRQN